MISGKLSVKGLQGDLMFSGTITKTGVKGLQADLPGQVFYGIAGKSAYKYAQEAGYTGTEEEFAQKLAEPSSSLDIKTDNTLSIENGVLSVRTTDEIEEDNTLPITSAGVFATVGNIEALLNTI